MVQGFELKGLGIIRDKRLGFEAGPCRRGATLKAWEARAASFSQCSR